MDERRITESEEAQTDAHRTQKSMEKALLALQDKAEDLEARSRRSNLRITGVPESTVTGNMELFIEKLLTNLLGPETFSSTFVVERAHRSLDPWPPPGATPCPIIAKLLNYRDRDAALRTARELKSLHYEGSTLSLFPDFTLKVQEARRQFAPVKRKLREQNIEYAMLYPARLRVCRQGKLQVFTDPRALQKAIKEWGRDDKSARTTEGAACSDANMDALDEND